MTNAPLCLHPPLDETAADIGTALQSVLDAERPSP